MSDKAVMMHRVTGYWITSKPVGLVRVGRGGCVPHAADSDNVGRCYDFHGDMPAKPGRFQGRIGRMLSGSKELEKVYIILGKIKRLPYIGLDN